MRVQLLLLHPNPATHLDRPLPFSGEPHGSPFLYDEVVMEDEKTTALALNRVEEGSLLPDMKPVWKMDVISRYPHELTPPVGISHGYQFEITGAIPQTLDHGFHGGPVDMDALGVWMNAQAYFGGRLEAAPTEVEAAYVETYAFDWYELDLDE